MNTEKIILPNEILYAINSLEAKGFKAYVVGGAVRDFVLKREISDYDITTDARPEDIHKMFEKCIDTGLKHGTVTVVINHTHIEITTFRWEGNYTDHRRPDSVSFSESLTEDLSRRDFTVNALAYSPKEGIKDYFGGISDCKNKILRCVGEAQTRFEEDALRMLRLIRFSTKLGFDAEKNTLEALKKKEKLINYVSKERIREELIKILTSDFPEKIMNFDMSDIFDIIFETDFFEKITLDKTNCLKALEKSHILRISYILSELFPCEPEKAKHILSSLKFSNNEKHSIMNTLGFLNEYRQKKADINSDCAIKKSIAKYGIENLYFALEILKFSDNIYSLISKLKRMEENNEPYLISHLNINGKDLIKIGFDGKETGKCLDLLLEMVIKNPDFNTKENLMKEAEKIYAKKSLC